MIEEGGNFQELRPRLSLVLEPLKPGQIIKQLRAVHNRKVNIDIEASRTTVVLF
jgi:hypothetical protein